MALAGLVALFLAATTESILTVSDGVFIIMFPTAVIAGLWERHVGSAADVEQEVESTESSS